MNNTFHSNQPVSIEIEDVNLYYGSTHVLKDVSLSISPGELFAFLGPSGCGKTTLLRLIAGFNVSQTGTVKLSGQEISHLPPWKRDVGMVFQSYALWPHMSVAKNVAFGLEERRLPKAEVEQRVNAALELVGLQMLRDRKPSQLSGGQQQRVALARTIAIQPKILLLDEPLSNLDAKMRVDVRQELRELQQRLGITTVFVTHDQEEANTISDRIAIFEQGQVQQVGTPIDLYDNPKNLFVASFLGSANILNGTVTHNGFMLNDGTTLPVGTTSNQGQSNLVFRPQNLLLHSHDSNQKNSNLLDGVIIRNEFLGSIVRYIVRVGSNDLLVDIPHQAGGIIFNNSQVVKVEIDYSRAIVLGVE